MSDQNQRYLTTSETAAPPPVSSEGVLSSTFQPISVDQTSVPLLSISTSNPLAGLSNTSASENGPGKRSAGPSDSPSQAIVPHREQDAGRILSFIDAYETLPPDYEAATRGGSSNTS